MSERGAEIHEKVVTAAGSVAREGTIDAGSDIYKNKIEGIAVARDKIFAEGLTEEEIRLGAEDFMATMMGEGFRKVKFSDLRRAAGSDPVNAEYVEQGSKVFGEALYEAMMATGDEKFDFLLAEGSAFNIDEMLPEQLKECGQYISENVVNNELILEKTRAFDKVLQEWKIIGHVSDAIRQKEYGKLYDELYKMFHDREVPDQDVPQLIMVLGGVTEKLNKNGANDPEHNLYNNFQYVDRMNEAEQKEYFREGLKYYEFVEVERSNLTYAGLFKTLRTKLLPHLKNKEHAREVIHRLNLNDMYYWTKDADGLIGEKIGINRTGNDYVGNILKDEKGINKDFLEFFFKLNSKGLKKINRDIEELERRTGVKLTTTERFEYFSNLGKEDRESLHSNGLPVFEAFNMNQRLGYDYQNILFEIARDAETNEETRKLLASKYGKHMSEFTEVAVLIHKPLTTEELELVQFEDGRNIFFEDLQARIDAETSPLVQLTLIKELIDWQMRLGVDREEVESYVADKGVGLQKFAQDLLKTRDKEWRDYPNQKDWFDRESKFTQAFEVYGSVNYGWFYDEPKRQEIVKDYMIKKLAHLDEPLTKAEKDKRLDEARQGFEIARRIMFAIGERDIMNPDTLGPATQAKIFLAGMFRWLEYFKTKKCGPVCTLDAFMQAGTSYLRLIAMKTAKDNGTDIEFGPNKMVDISKLDPEKAEGKFTYYNWCTALGDNKFQEAYNMLMDGNFDKDLTNVDKIKSKRDAWSKTIKQGGKVMKYSLGSYDKDIELAMGWYLVGQIMNGLNTDQTAFNFEMLKQIKRVWVTDNWVAIVNSQQKVLGYKPFVPEWIWNELVMKNKDIWRKIRISDTQKQELAGRGWYANAASGFMSKK